MSVVKFIRRIERVNDLIKRRATGNPAEFAQKLHLSESRLYEILKELKTLGLPIAFSHADNSYCYDGSGGIEVKIKGKTLQEKEMENTKGGTGFICSERVLSTVYY